MSESSQQNEARIEGGYLAVFDAMDPSEFMTLHRIAGDVHDDGLTRSQIQAAVCAVEESRLEYNLYVYTGEYLDILPSRDLDRAKLIYETFAASPRAADRHQVARLCPRELTRVDYQAGVDLWYRLIRDPDEGVRREARDEFKVDAPDLTERWALTREDALRLHRAYWFAEQGVDLHCPFHHAGEIALKHFVRLLDVSAKPQAS